ncbi:hypothetical protein J4Q44_G00145660 [Coregonus suidteri]|uniref:Uncharacterized protein n=1 Tax=Coregonus suidteri TaxID=861788 RepID=A0AAN8R666_9TELE
MKWVSPVRLHPYSSQHQNILRPLLLKHWDYMAVIEHSTCILQSLQTFIPVDHGWAANRMAEKIKVQPPSTLVLVVSVVNPTSVVYCCLVFKFMQDFERNSNKV